MMPEDALLTQDHGDGVLVLRLNRPEKSNALATPLLAMVAQALAAADDDAAVRCVVITGGDTIFAAGADINELATASSEEPLEGPRFLAWKSIRAFSKPLVAAVEGWCLGAGAELMMCCDLVVAAETARFGQPETNLGIIPGAGGTALLPRLVGLALALDMVLTGEPIAARRAYEAGLISRIAPKGEAIATALSLATKLASRAPVALRIAKQSVRAAMEQPLTVHLTSERTAFISLLGGAELEEGIAAFRGKRPALWP
jgi:enoyl-CoA hydratase